MCVIRVYKGPRAATAQEGHYTYFTLGLRWRSHYYRLTRLLNSTQLERRHPSEAELPQKIKNLNDNHKSPGERAFGSASTL